VFFERRLDGETPRTKRLWVYALGEKKERCLRCGFALYRTLHKVAFVFCLSAERCATARSAS
jgi:hypothetical protein